MKKSLIALAVLAASGAAMAQSSVTLYGVIDAGVVKRTDQTVALNGNLNGTSRIGLRGTEDLGGGLKASFNLEQGIDPGNGGAFSTGSDVVGRATGGGSNWARAAYAELSGGFGAVRLGRSLNPSYNGMAAWELTGAANYSAVASQFGFVGDDDGRNNAQIAYTSPNFGGVTASAAVVLKGNTNVAAAGAPKDEKAKYDLNVVYANGPIAAGFSYNKVKDYKANMSLGGSYDLGVAKIAASYQAGYSALRSTGGWVPSSTAQTSFALDQQKYRGFTVGATVPVGAFAVTLDIARDTEAKDTNVLLEGKYALSKRTFTYAYYLNNGKNDFGVAKVNTVGLGVRHNF
ncbi:MAG: porin [Giesbergeria sp.]|uniref:porin n=1 Tax=Giesbergeria sp. TaxID=2818473 RepID=UPI002615378F|nr:porin [Giesbergeria sp.]MDD2608831.1 porin [Giesbergeria sp.]